MKYIIFKNKHTRNLFPVLFSDKVNHKDVEVGEMFKPISAGFCYLKNFEIKVNKFMKSESLNLKPNYERDEKLLNDFILGLNRFFYE